MAPTEFRPAGDGAWLSADALEPAEAIKELKRIENAGYVAGNAMPVIRSHAANRASEAVGPCVASWVSAGAKW